MKIVNSSSSPELKSELYHISNLTVAFKSVLSSLQLFFSPWVLFPLESKSFGARVVPLNWLDLRLLNQLIHSYLSWLGSLHGVLNVLVSYLLLPPPVLWFPLKLFLLGFLVSLEFLFSIGLFSEFLSEFSFKVFWNILLTGEQED